MPVRTAPSRRLVKQVVARSADEELVVDRRAAESPRDVVQEKLDRALAAFADAQVWPNERAQLTEAAWALIEAEAEDLVLPPRIHEASRVE